MVDTKRTVETTFVAVDQTTAKLNKMHGAAMRVNNIFNRASATVAQYGGIAAAAAGGFAVGSAIIGAQRYLQTVRDISAATGFAASNVDAVLEVMDRANISADEGSQIIQKMSIAQQRYRMEVAKTGKAQSDASMIIKRLGINIDKGPQAAMVQLAAAAKQGKLSMADLVIAFQVSETGAIRLQSLLKRGPQEVGRIMSELQQQGLAVNAQNIAAFNRYEEATIKIRSAWARIALVVSTKVMPVVAGLLEKVSDRLEGWTLKAAVWGESVSKFLKDHLSTIIKIGKVMAINAALQKITGMGIGGIAGRAAGGVGRFAGGGAGAGPPVQTTLLKSLLDVTKRAARKVGIARAPLPSPVAALGLQAAKVPVVPPTAAKAFFSRVFTPIGIFFKSIFGKAGGVLGKAKGAFGILGKVLPGLLKVGSVIMRLSVVGAAIGVVVGIVMAAVQGIRENALGIRDVVLGFWAQFQARFAVMWDIISPLFKSIGKVFSKEGIIGRFFLVVLGTVFATIGNVVDGILRVMQTVMLAVADILSSPRKLLSPTALVGAFSDAWLEAGRLTKLKRVEMAMPDVAEGRLPGAVRPPPGARPPPPVFDFRNSKFDIKQMFAEGFDPDRIAVAFTNDLAALGEKRLQSGLSPLFAVR